jgi:hypothetical protein
MLRQVYSFSLLVSLLMGVLTSASAQDCNKKQIYLGNKLVACATRTEATDGFRQVRRHMRQNDRPNARTVLRLYNPRQ